VPGAKGYNPAKQEDKDKARAMRQEGQSVAFIASSLGYSSGAVSGWCRDIVVSVVKREAVLGVPVVKKEAVKTPSPGKGIDRATEEALIDEDTRQMANVLRRARLADELEEIDAKKRQRARLEALELAERTKALNAPFGSPPPPPPPQPGLIEQTQGILGLITAVKSALMPAPSPDTGGQTPVQIMDSTGKPLTMDIGSYIQLRQFESRAKIEGERHGALMGLAQTVRENFASGIEAVRRTAEGLKAGGTKASAPQPRAQPPAQPAPEPLEVELREPEPEPEPPAQQYECGSCHTVFGVPDVPFETVICPNSECKVEYTREQILGKEG